MVGDRNPLHARTGLPARLVRLGVAVVLAALMMMCSFATTGQTQPGLRSPDPEAPADGRTAVVSRGAPATRSPDALPTATTAPTPTFVPTQQPLYSSAHVIYEGSDGLSLRNGPGGEKVGALLAGSSLRVTGNARDEGGFRWWPVELDPGWMIEGPGDRSQPRWLVPVQGATLQAGAPAMVAYTGPDGLNLRQTPGPDGALIATFLHGSLVTVLEPAQNVGGAAWWRVSAPSGWMAEGPVDPALPRWLSFTSP